MSNTAHQFFTRTLRLRRQNVVIPFDGFTAAEHALRSAGIDFTVVEQPDLLPAAA